ncbi:hypothetical protein [Actinoallomurus acanthiterrae]
MGTVVGMVRLYDPGTGRVAEVVPARPGVLRVGCAEELRAQVVGDLIRRLAEHHRLRAVGIWNAVPGAPDLGIRPAQLPSGPADVRVGEAVGRWDPAPWDGLDPLAVRLALLETHYRVDVAHTRADLARADASLTAWRRGVAGWAESPGRPLDRSYVAEAVAHLDDDLDTPAALSALSRLATDESVPPGAKFETAIALDMILGLDLVRLVGRL